MHHRLNRQGKVTGVRRLIPLFRDFAFTLQVGQLPLGAPTLKETYMCTKKQCPVPWHISLPARSLIRRMLLQANPQRRPNMVAILQDDLLSCGPLPSRFPTSCPSTQPRFDTLNASLTVAGRKPLLERNTGPVEELVRDPLANLQSLQTCLPSRAVAMSVNGQRKGSQWQALLSELLRRPLDLLGDPRPPQRCLAAADEAEDPAGGPLSSISKWADYTDMYGLGYRVCDDSIGVLYNGNTRMVLSNRVSPTYVDENSLGNYYSLEEYPAALPKVTLLKLFYRSMKQCSVTDGQTAWPLESATTSAACPTLVPGSVPSRPSPPISPTLPASASRSGSRRASRSASRHASRHASRSASRSASRGRDSSDRVSWADAARGKVKSSSVSSNSATTSRSTPSSWQAWTTSPYYKELEQLRATNATLVKTTRRLAQELAEVKKELQAQQAQPITAPRQSNETPTPAVTNEQSTCTPSDQGTQSMDTAQDAPQEEKTTDPTPKKRARTSSQNHTELTELETKLEAKIEAIGNTYASTAAVTDQRLARLEELITTSFRNIQEQFGFIEQTLKPIVCSPIFAVQFGNHPYLQEQTQAPTPLQSCPSPKPE
ncbi:hypothetical protein HPB48_015977 [Haemaphysalis longicornis]|uniref:POLO box domain-containing protein n=1 Tax=Haemaphysalis longicornis TaxID=44386 RepID=A0A9J6G695_HAELO|nr:hypothetical protein HPB48_015977 [Haemaphysalis longicornis]